MVTTFLFKNQIIRVKREREEKKTEVLEEEHNEPLTGLRLAD